MSLVAIGPPAKAEDAAAPSNANKSQLEEIVVTAQRRSERLQDVPIAVTAIGKEELLQSGVRDTQELTALVPGLQITRQNNSALPFLRGVGSNNGIIGNESSVSIYVDGVYRPSLTAGVFSLASVDRIEVLKGPQGTLFGRNATGGVVQVITEEPNQTPSLNMSARYGSFNTTDLNLLANTPITDSLAMNLAVYDNDQRDGWGRDLATGGDVLSTREWAIRPRLSWRGSTTKIGLNYSYDHVWSDVGSVGVPLGSTVLLSGSTNAGFFNVYNGAPTQFSSRDSHVIDAHIEQEIGPLSLVSITSYQHDSSFLTVSEDQTQLNLLTGALDQRERTWTQEVQLLSDPTAALRWIVGAFYFNSEAQYAPFRLGGPALAAPPPNGPGLPFQQVTSSQTTKSWAEFGQATLTILPKTDLTLGLRYTRDTHEFTGLVSTQAGLPGYPPNGVLVNQPGTNNSVGQPTWRISLDRKLTPDMMIYTSYNRGFKSGQFNLALPQDPPVRPEVLDAYEVGFKSELFDQKVRLNASAFYYNYKDIQVQLIQDTQPLFLNAAHAKIKGFDVDMAARLTPQFRLQGGLAYTDGHYDNFTNAPFYVSNAPLPGDTEFTHDASGNRTIQTPLVTATIGGNYQINSSVGPLQLAANYSYNSGYFFAPDNRVSQPAFHLVSSSLSWQPENRPYNITLWGKNLLDQHYLYSIIEATTGDFGIPAAPRTFGVRASVKF